MYIRGRLYGVTVGGRMLQASHFSRMFVFILNISLCYTIDKINVTGWLSICVKSVNVWYFNTKNSSVYWSNYECQYRIINVVYKLSSQPQTARVHRCEPAREWHCDTWWGSGLMYFWVWSLIAIRWLCRHTDITTSVRVSHTCHLASRFCHRY